VKKKITITCILLCFILGAYLLLNPTSDKKYEELHENTDVALEMAQVEAEDSPTINISDEEKSQASKEVQTGDITGSIVIPSLNINLAIVEGSTDENLYKGATTLIEGKKMGQGNYSLAGHHMKDDSLFFSQLENIKKGSKIYLTDFEYIYVYESTDIKTVHETETDILKAHPGKSEVTLITCDRPTATELRTVVTGVLDSKSDYTKEAFDKIKEF
jgi:LPXTG-site transpeptidase (sortase) family protein